MGLELPKIISNSCHCTFQAPPLGVRLSRGVIRLMPRGRYFWIRKLSRWTRWEHPFIARFDESQQRFIVDLTQLAARNVFYYGFHERALTSVFLHLLKEGDTVIDVGANFGYFTMLAARRVGCHGRVVAFEPEPQNQRWLQQNLALNGYEWVEVSDFAIASGQGTVHMDAGRGTDNRGRTSTVVKHISHGALIDVRTLGLDGFCDRAGIRVVDLLKVDIEGGEASAIQGMVEGIKEHRYRRILMEIHPQPLAEIGATSGAILAPFRNAGYGCYLLTNNTAGGCRHYSLRFSKDLIRKTAWPDNLTGTPKHFLLLAPVVDLPIGIERDNMKQIFRNMRFRDLTLDGVQ